MCRTLITAFVLALSACAGESSSPIAFTQVAPGIEVGTFSERANPAFSGHAFLVDLTQVDLAIVQGQERKRVSELAAAFPQHLAVNASFFDPRGRAMGRVADAGRVLANGRQGKWGALVVDAGVARVVSGDALPVDAPGGELVVQGVPRLLVDGAVPKLKAAAAERTAVCAEGRNLVVVVTTAPADASDFARWLARPRAQGGLGCTSALNLDGGPSTQANVRLGGYKLGIDGGWAVPNALVVVPRGASHPPAPLGPALPPDGGAASPQPATGP